MLTSQEFVPLFIIARDVWVNRNDVASSYEVTVESKEMRHIDGCIPLAVRLCPDLKSHDGYENIFDRVSNDLFSIDTDEEGNCAFAYFEDTGILCSLHAAAEKAGISFRKAKPQSCLLWPLAVSGGTVKTLSVQDDAFEFVCNTRSNKDAFSLCPNIAKNIEWAFGVKFRKKVQAAAHGRLNRAGISHGRSY